MNRIALPLCAAIVVAMNINLALTDEETIGQQQIGLRMGERLVPLNDVSADLRSTCSRNLGVD